MLSIVKFFSSMETQMILKVPNKIFLRITRYLVKEVVSGEKGAIWCKRWYLAKEVVHLVEEAVSDGRGGSRWKRWCLTGVKQ